MNHKERTNLLEKALELHKANSHDDADKIYSRVREACPRDFDAWFLSGAMAFQRGGHLEQAIELLKTARKLNPSSIECRMFLGMALADLGRHSEATPHLETTLKKFPHQTEVWKNLAKCKHSTGNLSGAREALEKLAQLEPNNPASHEMLGELVAELSGFQQAESHFRRALELDPNMAMAWSNLGLSLIEQSGHMAKVWNTLTRLSNWIPFL